MDLSKQLDPELASILDAFPVEVVQTFNVQTTPV
jgi:hypothetical protein